MLAVVVVPVEELNVLLYVDKRVVSTRNALAAGLLKKLKVVKIKWKFNDKLQGNNALTPPSFYLSF